jgi:hypothetical protein
MLGPLRNRKSDLTVWNGVLLYKQFIRLMMDCVCPALRTAAPTHVRRLHVLQSKCLRLATGSHWYVTSRQNNEDLGVPLFADQIRAVTASFDSKLTDVRKALVRQIGRYADRGMTPSPEAKAKGSGASRPVEAIARDGQVD